MSHCKGFRIQDLAKIIVIPSSSNSVLCQWEKLADSLGSTKLTTCTSLRKQRLELSTCMWSGCAPWNCSKFEWLAASSKQFLHSFFLMCIFELGGITKHLMTGPVGNSEFCFLSTLMFPLALSRGTLRFPLGPVFKCLLCSGVRHF